MTILAGTEAAEHVRQQLLKVGAYQGIVDGGPGTIATDAVAKALGLPVSSTPAQQIGSLDGEPRLCWGARVSRVFRDRIHWMADELGMPKATGADDIMACIAWESGETFSPSVKNMAGSGATGLIQFMPETAIGLKTTVAKLAQMTAEDQLNYVYKYFKPYAGKLNDLGDLYMAILWPAGVGKPMAYTLWDKNTRPTTYRQNSGLDVNKDGKITKGEAVQKVSAKKAKGYLPGNVLS